MPPHESIGPHNRQELAPVDERREQNECDSRGVVRAARSDLAFDVTGELLPEEQVLGHQVRAGPEHQPQKPQQVREGRTSFSARLPDHNVSDETSSS